MKVTRQCRVLAVLSIAACSCGRPTLAPSASDDFRQRRERAAYETIRGQIAASGSAADAAGPFLDNAERLARRLEALLPQGRIKDDGRYGPRRVWKRVEVLTTGWSVEIRVNSDRLGAARDMARGLSQLAAAFQPGAVSGATIGQARYCSGPEALVFLRQNVVVWVRFDRSRAGVHTAVGQATSECDGIARRVDGEVLTLLSGK